MDEQLRPFRGAGSVIVRCGPEERLETNLALGRTPGFEAGIFRGRTIVRVVPFDCCARLQKLPSGFRPEHRGEGVFRQPSIFRVPQQLFRSVELLFHDRPLGRIKQLRRQGLSEIFGSVLGDGGASCGIFRGVGGPPALMPGIAKKLAVWFDAAMSKLSTRPILYKGHRDYIEVFYKQGRRHPTLRQISPATFERRALQAA